MKKSIKQVTIVFLILLLTISVGNVFAIDTKTVIRKSEEFEKWEQLSDSERETIIQPELTTISAKDSIKRSKYNSILSSSGQIGSRYNLKDNINIIVKNQRGTNSCWAFAFTNMIETTLAKKNNNVFNEYSPMHAEYKVSSMYNKRLVDGGNAYLALAYSIAGYGPVYESDLPFNSVYNETTNSANNYYLKNEDDVNTSIPARVNVSDASFLGGIYKEYGNNTITYKDNSGRAATTTYTQNEVDAIRNVIKEHIKDKGAVQSTMYSDMGINANGAVIGNNDFLNSSTNAYYCNDTTKLANHAITIVGWDDTYSKNNFNSNKRPIHDGAYIVLNSWGEDRLDHGYFYISYDDAFVEQDIIGINDIENAEEISESYDNIYQYDELGSSFPLYYLKEDQQDIYSEGYAANVFERKDNSKIEYLNEVGISLLESEGVEIYVNPQGDNLSISNAQLVASNIGVDALEAGFHRVKLATPIKLTGNKYSVIVKYINQEGASTAIECNIKDSGITTASNYFDSARSNNGESFISKDGTNWNDLNGYNYVDYSLRNSNVCIKAYTNIVNEDEVDVTNPDNNTDEPGNTNNNEVIEVEKVKLNKDLLSIKVGDTTTIVARVYPTNATNQGITWSTTNSNIVEVDSNGMITAKSSGIAYVIATTTDGKNMARCKVTVTGKENVSDDIYIPSNSSSSTSNNSSTNSSSGTSNSNSNTSNSSNSSTTPSTTTSSNSYSSTSSSSSSSSYGTTNSTSNGSSASQIKYSAITTTKSTNSDKTVSSSNLPKTGSETILIILSITLTFSVVIFIRYRSFKDIK